KILALAQEVAKNMFLTKLKVQGSAFLCAGLLAAALGGSLALAQGGAGSQAQVPYAQSPPQPAPTLGARPTPPQPGGPKPAEAEPAQMSLRGRVLDLDDKPVVGARVYLLQWNQPGRPPHDKAPPKVWAETDKDGRFSFRAAQRDLGELFVMA